MPLIIAGIIHNISFTCRKLAPEELKTFYPATPIGKLISDLNWVGLTAIGLYLTAVLSLALGFLAAVICFLLQPPLSCLLGFKGLADDVNHIDGKNPD